MILYYVRDGNQVHMFYSLERFFIYCTSRLTHLLRNCNHKCLNGRHKFYVCHCAVENHDCDNLRGCSQKLKGVIIMDICTKCGRTVKRSEDFDITHQCCLNNGCDVNYQLSIKDKFVQLESYINQIKSCYKRTVSNFIGVGYYASKIKESDLHVVAKGGSYSANDFYKFAKEYFGLSKSTVCKYIQVADEFGNTDEIKKEYELYSFTQLCEFFNVPRDKWNLINPSMSCSEIRGLGKKSCLVNKTDEGEDSDIELMEAIEPQYTTEKIIFETSVIKKLRTHAEHNKLGVNRYVNEMAKNYFKLTEVDQEEKEEAETFEALPLVAINERAFKNDKEREEFLEDCENWTLWLDIPVLHVKIHRAELSNGSVLLGYVYPGRYGNLIVYSCFENENCIRFSSDYTTESVLVEYIRKNKLTAKY